MKAADLPTYYNICEILEQNLESRSDKTALLSENKSLTFREVSEEVNKVGNALIRLGVRFGDCVAILCPDLPEWVSIFFATAKIGGVSLGLNTLLRPDEYDYILEDARVKVLVVHESLLRLVEPILKKHNSLANVIVITDCASKHYTTFKDWIDSEESALETAATHREDFCSLHYSSGTTGKPKCICHRTGGVLIQHKKEHQLHCDIKEGDNVFYFTTCGWMMWNWLVSVLASKASIVLFDGSPMFKKEDLLLKIAEKENITFLGISAKYVDALRKLKPKLKYKYNLEKLKTICSTGSPLSNEGFKYVYQNIKKNVHLASISGGTDIVSCFVLGNLYQPVHVGEIQNKGLALNIDIFNDKGKSIMNKKGELICKNPFPSMPLKFWNDKNDEKYKNAYFNRFPNVWHHGDFAEIKKNNGFVIHGRSDTTLNPGGVRLGTAEIYAEIEQFKEIRESLVVGQSWDNDIRIILFVILNPKYQLTNNVVNRIKLQIKKNVSPRHVPNKIIQINDIPRTKSGKIVELAVKNTIEGIGIKNKEALSNPQSLNQFKNIKELKY